MEAKINELLMSPGARFVAIASTGATVLVPPARFIGLASWVSESQIAPLEMFDAGSQGRVVSVFNRSRQEGSATSLVALRGNRRTHSLTIFDLEESDSCMLAVLVPSSEQLSSDLAPNRTPLQSHMTMSADAVALSVSDDFGPMFGLDNADIIGRSALDFIHPDDHEHSIAEWAQVLAHYGPAEPIRQRFKCSDGGWLWCDSSNINHLDDSENPRIQATIMDISAEVRAVQALELREAMLGRLQQALPTGLIHVDLEDEVVSSNTRWTELTGLNGATGLDGLLGVVAQPGELLKQLAQAKGGEDIDHYVALSGAGICKFGELHLRRLDFNGSAFGLLVTLDDITRLQNQQLELSDLLRTDPLTGILNRRGLEGALSEALSLRIPEFTVLFLDLDGFKEINDKNGHRVGDEVLKNVANGLKAAIRPCDAVGRLGGDEFLVVARGAIESTTIATISERIESAGRDAAELSQLATSIGISIGSASAQVGDDVDAVLMRADQAMYQDKRERATVTETLEPSAPVQ